MCVYGACLFFMSVVVTVWGFVGIFVVYRPLLKIGGLFNLDVLKYDCVRDVMDVVFSVCIVMRRTVGARVCEV